MRKWVYAVLLSIVLIGCKTGQPELKNPIVVDTGFVLQDNYYGGAMQWEPNDRDAMTEAQWERLFKRVRYMNLGYIRCCIMPYFYCFGYEGQEPVLIWDMDSTKVDARWYANSRRYMNDLYRQLQFCKDNDSPWKRKGYVGSGIRPDRYAYICARPGCSHIRGDK